jgi:hypothetical protein
MDESLTDEPVSIATPAFRELLVRTFADRKVVIFLFRYANCGGAKDYFIARSPAEFETVVNHARAKTSITAFFEGNFKLKGTTDDELCARTIDLLPSVQAEYEGVDIVRIDGPGTELNVEHYSYLTEPEEIREWFRNNSGARILVGTMEFWHDNCPEIVTVYVPDDDGVVRPGAY